MRGPRDERAIGAKAAVGHQQLNVRVPVRERAVRLSVAELYVHMCPAGVYELDGERLVVSAANCVDCKATDVIGPRWTPREGESGPKYRLM